MLADRVESTWWSMTGTPCFQPTSIRPCWSPALMFCGGCGDRAADGREGGTRSETGDFRNGFDRPVAVVQEALRCHPFCGDLLIFRSKRLDMVKILAWDGSSLCLFDKCRHAAGHVASMAAASIATRSSI
ncbi:transposase [Caenispirillum bisanense]|uniref:transposase n=1 Tax=Caenispirillum bisanense TaxID=414052 RepID=UPI001FE2B5EA|nr:transposase [Caenispirillum bisanense]